MGGDYEVRTTTGTVPGTPKTSTQNPAVQTAKYAKYAERKEIEPSNNAKR